MFYRLVDDSSEPRSVLVRCFFLRPKGQEKKGSKRKWQHKPTFPSTPFNVLFLSGVNCEKALTLFGFLPSR